MFIFRPNQHPFTTSTLSEMKIIIRQCIESLTTIKLKISSRFLAVALSWCGSPWGQSVFGCKFRWPCSKGDPKWRLNAFPSLNIFDMSYKKKKKNKYTCRQSKLSFVDLITREVILKLEHKKTFNLKWALFSCTN